MNRTSTLSRFAVGSAAALGFAVIGSFMLMTNVPTAKADDIAPTTASFSEESISIDPSTAGPAFNFTDPRDADWSEAQINDNWTMTIGAGVLDDDITLPPRENERIPVVKASIDFNIGVDASGN